ncbi:hypothetical protein B0O80DRAFT_426234 [Mortierella sp. GBAus27b]|nr:hypothetical protein BGX31_009653 [Mortierella sp. GBA43]KAI8355005.1 hypothetical protein B0O80DRAFT_426234 [Mortierella sp. GBAus27b]
MAAESANTQPEAFQDPSQIGTIFAHEYYTFLNKEPSSLHKFYIEHAVMTHGYQGGTVSTSSGLKAIQAKIEHMQLEDCKVLISDIDSQSSVGQGILIQVLGEMSNRGGPAKKFAQSFFLATHEGSFYVLNDIFRYLRDDNEDGDGDINEATAEAHGETQGETILEADTVAGEEDTPAIVSESAVSVETTDLQETSTASYAITDGQILENSDIKVTKDVTPEPVAEPIKAEDTPAPLAPVADPAATLAPASAIDAAAEQTLAPATPAGPPKAMSWANTAASNSNQWGSKISSTKATTVVPVTTPAASSKPQPAQPQPGQTNKPPQGRDKQKLDPLSVFIKDITSEMTISVLSEAFKVFGQVNHVELQGKKNATIEFSSQEAASEALSARKILIVEKEVRIEERWRSTNNGPHNGARSSNSNHHYNNSAANGHGHGQQHHQHHQQGGNRGSRANTPRRPGPNRSDKTPQPTASK